MSTFQIIGTDSPEQWSEVLERSFAYDIYHLPAYHALAELGECRPIGETVSISLTAPPEAQYAAYRKNHKNGINRLKRAGVSCLLDRGGRYLDDFISMYYETMDRVNAAGYYYFDAAYF